MLLIQGCSGVDICGLNCNNQIELPIFEVGSGHRYGMFCKSCSYCKLKVKFQLLEYAAPQDNKDDSQNVNQQLKSKIADYVCAELLISKHSDKYKKVLSAIECATSDL